MQVTVPPQATHSSYELGFPRVAMPSPAVAQQHEVGFKPRDRKSMKILSAMQIAIGISCIVIYIVLLAIQRGTGYPDYISAGIWCGALYIIAGSLGVAGARKYQSDLIGSAMVMSILSSMILWAVVVFACIAIAYNISNSCKYGNDYGRNCYFYNFTGYQFADIILIILSFAEFIISIWCTVLCSKALCKACCSSCCKGNNYGYEAQTICYAQAQSAGQQVILVPQAGVAGGHVVALMPAQPPYLGMQQQQPALFVHPAAPVAAVAPASYQPSVAGPPGHPANQVGDATSGFAAYRPTLEVTKDRTAGGY